MIPKPDDCIGCIYYEHWQKNGYVPGDGPRHKGVTIIVAEAAGEDEERRGIPLCGGSGRVIQKWTAESNQKWEHFYKTNVLKCRPPGNEDPDPRAVAHCAPQLERELEELEPNLIVTLGDHALKWFTGRTKISQVMGYTFPFRKTKVLALGHPAWIMRVKNTVKGKNLWALSVAYLGKAKRLGASPGLLPPPEPFNEEPTLKDVVDFCERVEGEVILDVENTRERRRDCVLQKIGLGLADGSEYISIEMNPEHWVDYEYLEMIRWVGGLLASPNVMKSGQNLTHDVEVLEYHGFKMSPPFWDTILAHHVVYGEMPHRLAVIAPLYSDREYWKDMVKIGEEDK